MECKLHKNRIIEFISFLVFPGILTSLIIFAISRFSFHIGYTFCIYLIMFSIMVGFIYILYKLKLHFLTILPIYFLFSFLFIYYAWKFFNAYIPFDEILLIFMLFINSIGIFLYIQFRDKITLKKIKPLMFSLIALSVILTFLGVKRQVDVYNGYCVKEGRFLTEKEKIERVVNEIFNYRYEANNYLSKLDTCCSYKKPVNFWGGPEKDYAIKYRLQGINGGSVNIIKSNGGRQNYVVTNCGDAMKWDLLESGIYF